jgi:hypothetical protein
VGTLKVDANLIREGTNEITSGMPMPGVGHPTAT